MYIFFQTLLETLIADFFSLAYPISLNFLYKEEKYLNFYITIAIISLSIIYFISYLILNIKIKKGGGSKCAYYTRLNSFCILGYLVQFHLAFFNAIDYKDGKIKVNVTLLVLKIFMILEAIKRLYYYVIGIILLIILESKGETDRSYYVMTFEIVYYYLWYDFYQNFFSGGYELPKFFKIISAIVCSIYGVLAIFNCFLFAKIIIGVFNLVFLITHIYTIYWRYREDY